MNDAHSSDLPTVDELHGRHAATLAALRQSLGERPIEVATAGQLAALLARIPADTPLAVIEHLRVDPDLDEGSTESRTAVTAEVDTVFADEPIEAVDAHGRPDFYGCAVAGLALGAVRVARDGCLPVRSVAAQPYEQAIEALHTGDADGMLAAFDELIRFVAGMLDGIDDATLQEWIVDEDLAGQLQVEGDRLRQSAARLAVLRSRVTADLAAQDPAGHHDEDQPGR